jgi:EAL domain-containing protein (putative c-di-GMP-specific phosphodiesterase class I)
MAGVLPKPFSPKILRELLRHPGPEGSVAPPAPPAPPATPATTVADPPPGPTVAELSEAIAAGRIDLAYQPQIECSTGRLAGIEALARWHHPTLGHLPPIRFIPLAEQHGLMDELTFAVVRKALQWFLGDFAASAVRLPALPSLSVNISPSALRDLQFVEQLSDYCRGSGIEPARLIFELTETSAMEDPVASLDILTRLRMKGFQLSIDDFGTGFSSMLQLVRLPFSEIKIDKSFVMTATASCESQAVVRSVIELGHSLELRVVAEGVEDNATLRLLHDLGCDVAQGFFVGRPVPGNELLAWLARDATARAAGADQHLLL